VTSAITVGETLGQRNLGGLAGPAAGADLVRPRMIAAGRGQDGAELARLCRGERDGPADVDEFGALLPAGDHHLGPFDRAEDAADDHLDGVAVIEPSLGLWWRRALSQ
jgi:hypothetical protein